METFDLKKISLLEAKRRLKLLGDLVVTDYDNKQLHKQVSAARVPLRVFLNWLQSYKAGGIENLRPDWEALDKKSQNLVQERLEQLGDIINNELITDHEINEIAKRNGWSQRRTERWLHRYRAGGLWGLAPGHNPLRKAKKSVKRPRRNLGTLDENELLEVYLRLDILGPLAKKEKVTNQEMQDRVEKLQAKGIKVSERTLWNHRSNYQKYGLVGLARQQRSDKNSHYKISERIVSLTKGIRLSKPDWPIRAVHKEARKLAGELGEVEPTMFQVRSICHNIPEATKLLADGRYDEFRNKYRITYPIRFGTRTVYQIDHTQVDVLVRDIRAKRYRTKSGEIRPWLTLVMDSRSRLVMAAIFAYDQPDRFTVASAIRDSLLTSDKKPFGGIPDEIWIDNGKELLSRHVSELIRELNILKKALPPRQPQQKGIVERFFGTLNTWLWATLPGYVASNTSQRNPKARAELTLAELVKEFQKFIEQYHQEAHSETDETPLDFWMKYCFVEPVEARRLDVLLLEAKTRKVHKSGIKYEGRKYWHVDLFDMIGEEVIIRTKPVYTAPDEIEVFHTDEWKCTAFAIDSGRGYSVKRQEIRDAQRQQNQNVRQEITETRRALKEAEREIEKRNKRKTSDASERTSEPGDGQPQIRKAQKPKKSKKPRKKSLWERIGDDF